MAKLALQLLTYHEKSEVLCLLFDSLAAQTDQDWTLYWLDNASTNEERSALRAVAGRFTMIEGQGNLGFAGGHQNLYERHDADYVFCLNADVILEPEYIESLRRHLDDRPDVAAVAGTILRWDFGEQGQVFKSAVVDSLGLARARNHKVYDIDSGKTRPLTEGKTKEIYVWGVSGCLPIYRRLAVGLQLFDPSYFLYKEDVDLAYRLRKAGWKAAIVPEAVAYHHRTFRSSLLHTEVSFDNQWLSYRNHWRNLRRHLSLGDWLKDGWAILPFEFVKAWYMLFQYALRHRHHHRLH